MEISMGKTWVNMGKNMGKTWAIPYNMEFLCEITFFE
jgi:hypothetical protein